jgi:hypothetical protein
MLVVSRAKGAGGMLVARSERAGTGVVESGIGIV